MEHQVHNFGFADLSVGRNRHYHSFLDEVQKIFRWNIIEKQLQDRLHRDEDHLRGNLSYPSLSTLSMLKILLLQKWYNLSDQETEYSLNDRFSFSHFAGFSLDSLLPDHTTICRFRHRLLEKNFLIPFCALLIRPLYLLPAVPARRWKFPSEEPQEESLLEDGIVNVSYYQDEEAS